MTAKTKVTMTACTKGKLTSAGFWMTDRPNCGWMEKAEVSQVVMVSGAVFFITLRPSDLSPWKQHRHGNRIVMETALFIMRRMGTTKISSTARVPIKGFALYKEYGGRRGAGGITSAR